MLFTVRDVHRQARHVLTVQDGEDRDYGVRVEPRRLHLELVWLLLDAELDALGARDNPHYFG